jgi:hypothetical protein
MGYNQKLQFLQPELAYQGAGGSIRMAIEDADTVRLFGQSKFRQIMSLPYMYQAN